MNQLMATTRAKYKTRREELLRTTACRCDFDRRHRQVCIVLAQINSTPLFISVILLLPIRDLEQQRPRVRTWIKVFD